MPEEVHEHYNADGELVGTTRVTRESPWDEEQAALMEALTDAELLICPDCGGHRDDCATPAALNSSFPQRAICYRSMSREAAGRAYDRKHEDAPFHDGTFRRWSRDYSRGTPFHYRDGVAVWVAGEDVNPDDQFI